MEWGYVSSVVTYKFQGRRYRLTDVHGKVIEALLG